MLVELKNCQESNSLKSCTPCSQFFECQLRKNMSLHLWIYE